MYDDDGQIAELLARKRNLNGTMTISKVSPVLEEGLESGEEFVHVFVDLSPSGEEAR